MSDTSRNRLMLVIAILLAIVYLFPLYWMYVTSLKGGSEIFASPPTLPVMRKSFARGSLNRFGAWIAAFDKFMRANSSALGPDLRMATTMDASRLGPRIRPETKCSTCCSRA